MILLRTGGTFLLLLCLAPATFAEEPLPAGARMKLLVPGAAPGNRPWCVAFSPDGKTLAVGGSDKQIHLFDVATGRHLRCFGSHLDYVWTVAFSPDGKWIASGGRADFPVRIWSIDGEEQKPCEGEHHGGITRIKFFKDGKKLIMSGGSWDPTVRVWDFPNRKQLVEMKGHTDYIDAMDLASNERLAVTASRDGTWRLWDVRTGRQIRSHRAEQHGYASVAFSSDGHWFVTCDSVGIFQIWETASGLPRQAGSQDGSRNTVVAVSRDGRVTTCAIAGRRGLQVRITDTGEMLYLMGGRNDGVRGMGFSPDGRLLAS
ncbi:MAG TPA: WD40 repeat domain-containing protein, partial [Gemmataceae bacterium]|nr:WD40 repeat domain-containing protein [Gemmataceae bacterium]